MVVGDVILAPGELVAACAADSLLDEPAVAHGKHQRAIPHFVCILHFFLAGLAAGAATLVRPSWLLFTPLAVAASLVYDRPRWRRSFTGGLVMLVGCVLVLSP